MWILMIMTNHPVLLDTNGEDMVLKLEFRTRL